MVEDKVQIENNMVNLESYFQQFRKHIIGDNHQFNSINGKQKLIYADWGPMVANTHSFSSETGKVSTYAYKHARDIIKQHVNADKDDVLVTAGTGMTGVLSRLQRMMGLRYPDVLKDKR